MHAGKVQARGGQLLLHVVDDVDVDPVSGGAGGYVNINRGVPTEGLDPAQRGGFRQWFYKLLAGLRGVSGIS